jgi:hypothetical protein
MSTVQVVKTKIQDASQFMKLRKAISPTMQTPGRQISVDCSKIFEEFVSYGTHITQCYFTIQTGSLLYNIPSKNNITNFTPRLLTHLLGPSFLVCTGARVFVFAVLTL